MKNQHISFSVKKIVAPHNQYIDHDFKSEKISKTESKITELQEAVDKLDEEKIEFVMQNVLHKKQ